MFRDAATAATLGMSAGGIMDSFTLAFRLPDVARRMFGEGSLSVSFIPVFTRLWNTDRNKAWTLLCAVLSCFLIALLGFVLVGELLCFLGICFFPDYSKMHLVSQLTSLMLPYLILICLAAIAAATLQSLNNFSIPSLIPTILNICWLLGILIFAPLFTKDPLQRCFILTGFILFAGVIQLGIQVPFLRKHGFRIRCGNWTRWKSVKSELREIRDSFFPTMIGLMGTQLNILAACMIAWVFSGNMEHSIWWLGDVVLYPLQIGSASSIYFSERLYEFPQGLIGIAIATVIYPMLSRHATRGDFNAIAEDLTFGIRVIFALAIPSGIGLMFLSDNLAHLLYQRGVFTPADTERTADMIYYFSFGVCGFCSIPLLARAFYAVGDIRTPFRIAGASFAVNFFFGFSMIWYMQEKGLAIAAGLSANLHALVLLVVFARKYHLIDFRTLLFAIVRSCIASAAMGAAVMVIMDLIHGGSSLHDLLRIGFSSSIGFAVFMGIYMILGGREMQMFLKRKKDIKDEETTEKKRRKKILKRRNSK